MGGCSVSRTGHNVEALLEMMKTEIIKGMRMGLYPDSNLILLNPKTNETRTYKIDEDPRNETVQFQEQESYGWREGDGIAIEVAARYGEKPKDDEWIAMMHLHT